ncbi:MAG: hypothetical protein JO336_19310 [Acidobacteriia bacterium]|nr:hypothetical protein [Terriglobia bacterium]MBV8902517.1 hypothetical protein [Terriglobia bacterium]
MRVGAAAALASLLASIAAWAAPQPFFVHAYHNQLLGELECSYCHTPLKPGAVMLQRPAHAQCIQCHRPEFEKKNDRLLCAQCHSSESPSAADLTVFPLRAGTRAVLAEFSHAEHMDSKQRIDRATGFRADCAFCHHFPESGALATFPTHTECAACHANQGMTPHLAPEAQDCRGCHDPEETENPGSAGMRRDLAPVVVTGRYADIKFSHRTHFEARQREGLDCTTCHAAVVKSASLTTLALPQMTICATCHGAPRGPAAALRMTNCEGCHTDKIGPTIRPVSHTVSFRAYHADDAAAGGANCFACHQNVAANAEAKQQCIGCHQVMMPASHTARWKDDVHGKYAALDRSTCATCHATEFCSRCHNQLPQSHVPLPTFENGGHARLAELNLRACLTCHTFANTCSNCHTRSLR